MLTLTSRQRELIEIYVATYPHLAELAERAERSAGDMRTLGDAMAAQPYPQGVNGADALSIGKIGISK